MNQTDLTIEGNVARRNNIRVSTAQFTPTDEIDANLTTIDRLARDASAEGSQLVSFPEASMHTAWRIDPSQLSEVAHKHGERFVEQAQRIAERRQIALVVGSYHTSDSGEKPLNRLTAIGSDGSVLASYDKVHLYDAYSYKESDSVRHASIHGEFSELGLFTVQGWRVGLLNCYDVRFPELSRGLALRGADLISMSSGWVVGRRKENHLSILAAARAIENTVYFAVSNQSGTHSTGGSAVISPYGSTLSTVDEETGLASNVLKDELLHACRTELPVLENRRYSLTGAAC